MGDLHYFLKIQSHNLQETHRIQIENSTSSKASWWQWIDRLFACVSDWKVCQSNKIRHCVCCLFDHIAQIRNVWIHLLTKILLSETHTSCVLANLGSVRYLVIISCYYAYNHSVPECANLESEYVHPSAFLERWCWFTMKDRTVT